MLPSRISHYLFIIVLMLTLATMIDHQTWIISISGFAFYIASYEKKLTNPPAWG